MYNKIKKEIDAAIGKDVHEAVAHIEKALTIGVPYTLRDYHQSRKMALFLIEQLNRVNYVAINFMVRRMLASVRALSKRFSKGPTVMEKFLKENQNGYSYELANILFVKALDQFPKMHLVSEPVLKIAELYNENERRLVVAFCHFQIAKLAIKNVWKEDDVKMAMTYLTVEQAICKYDDVMEFFFNSVMSVIGRLNTSMFQQDAKDLSETALVIGYQEKMIEHAYVASSATYISSANLLPALLYMEIAFAYLNMKRGIISHRLSFDIIWEAMKILRESKLAQQGDVDGLLRLYDKIDNDAFERLSIYNTAITAKIFIGDESAIEDTIRFFRDNEADIIQSIKRTAFPLYMLLKGLQDVFSSHDLTELKPYEEMCAAKMTREGNEMYLDYYDIEKDLTPYLHEAIIKLKKTRNCHDYARGSRHVQYMAHKVIEKATAEDNAEKFLLAMQMRSDYTYIKDEEIKGPFSVLMIEDAKVSDHESPYIKSNVLKDVIKSEPEDAIIWIGCGANHFCRLTLQNDMFNMGVMDGVQNINLYEVQQYIISNIRFTSDYETSQGRRFSKSLNEYEEETATLKESLKAFTIPVPMVAGRLLFVKDMEIGFFPHHLFIHEREGEFVGQCMPTANVISTEFLIKTGGLKALTPDFSKSYWSPIQSGEITFSGIKEHLEGCLDKYHFLVSEKYVPSNPLKSDLNIVCAHGGKNISESEWFYANGKPIVDTEKIVGPGKLLVLFVCHSGSITLNDYDISVRSIIKRYLRMGYGAVIAPMWALSTEILPIWLEIFMELFTRGEYVIDAVYKANMEVKKTFDTPSAWACLHLFGNPYMRVVG